MAPLTPSSKGAPIVIVGAGIFGLSTAIYLAQRQYTNITIFDKQPYLETKYSYFNGCDSASSDINKIFRSAYGAQTEYQHVSADATKVWQAWNAELSSGKCVPPGMTTDDRLFINNGNLSLTDAGSLPPFEAETVKGMRAAGFPDTQFVTMDPQHARKAEELGYGFGIDPFQRKRRGKAYLGVLDTTGGTLLADKACRFALHKAQMLGVRAVFGPKEGAFERLTFEGPKKRNVTGIMTLDGRTHHAETVVMACGGWTPGLVPELDMVCETTCGSVVMLRIPKDSPLHTKYSPDNFPTWTWKIRDGATGGLYGFALTGEGLLKIGYRGEKFTNPRRQADNQERSVPVTRFTNDEKVEQIPAQALTVVKRFIAEWMPDLLEEPSVKLESTRLCWYNDSWDNHFVIDWVPGMEGVLVATAGSGHAFKYLPVIGNWVTDKLEGRGEDRQLMKSWKWRLQPTSKENVISSLMEGSNGARSLRNIKLTTDADLTLRERPHL